MTLVLIGLVGGIITGLSPCVLPVLPVVLLGGGSAGPDTGPDAESARRRPYLVVLGLTLSFAVFTLFGSLILASLHLPDDAIRWLGLALLVLVGLGLLVPPLGHLIERPYYRFPQRAVGTGRNGFLLGIALGAVFVPCAGPVLAAITVAGELPHVEAWAKDYGGEEQLIRQLLSAAHPGIALPRATDVPDTTPDDAAQTPETYLGAERQQGYHGSTPYVSGQFAAPATVPVNSFALAGTWTIGQESITAGQGAGNTLAFHALKVYLDVGGTGTLTVSAGDTSKAIRVSGAPDIYTVATEQPAGDRTVTIRLSPDLAAYSFTFG